MKLLDDKNNNQNGMKLDNGMSEKENLGQSNENIISTASDKADRLGMSNDLNSPLITNDEQSNGNISSNSLVKTDRSFLCYKPKDLNILYKGKIDRDLLNQEIYNSEFFVIKPSFHVYKLPKRLKIHKEEVTKISNDKIGYNGQNDMQELDTKNVHEKEKEDENFVENTAIAPDSNLYFPIGFNKNDNPLKLVKTNDIKNLIGEITFKEDDEKEGLIKKTEEKITNNKKHYRRIYRKELEDVKELALGAPFIKYHLMRNKYEDTFSSLNNLMEGIRDEKGKIIKKIPS